MTDKTLPPWQVERRVVLYRCMRCGMEWLPARWWLRGAALMALPQVCPAPACGSTLWNKDPERALRPTRAEIAQAEALARRRK